MAWRRLVERTTGWNPELYVPLRVALGADEAKRWARVLPEGKAEPSVVAGLVQRRHLERLRGFPEVFQVHDGEILMRFSSVEARSEAFQRAEAELRAEGFFRRWQDELYATRTRFSTPPLLEFHRGVGGLFGFSQFATHLNGFVRESEDPGAPVSHVWIATRSKSKNRWPSLLDSVVGGGLPTGISALENMVKEAHEEAGLDPEWTRSRLVATGTFTYVLDERNGLKNNTMFFYDLELPKDMTPVNRDGEVEKFELWTVEHVLQCMWDEPDRFKPDVCVMLLDFFVRHGVLTPDDFEDYQDLQISLRGCESPYEYFQ